MIIHTNANIQIDAAEYIKGVLKQACPLSKKRAERAD
jgi:hypothetical protein